MLLHGYECGKKQTFENFKTTKNPVAIMIDQNNWRMWNVLNIWVANSQLMEDVRVKLNPGLLWKKLRSIRRLSLPAT